MKKKVEQDFSYFDEYHLLSIASTLPDYTLAFFINKQLGMKLRRDKDFQLEGDGPAYPWFFYDAGEKYMSCYLIGNNHPERKLLTSLATIDYFFLIKNAPGQELVQEMAAKLRKTKNVMGVFLQNMDAVREMEFFLEAVELHEMEVESEKSRAQQKQKMISSVKRV